MPEREEREKKREKNDTIVWVNIAAASRDGKSIPFQTTAPWSCASVAEQTARVLPLITMIE